MIRPALEASGTQLAFVHMSDEATAGRFFAARGLDDVPRVSDPDQMLYRSFTLRRARLTQILNFSVIMRGFNALLRGHVNMLPVGDALRLGGTFLIHHGRVVREYPNKDVADRADYCALARPAS
jgi:hypothetical protein